MTAKYPAAAAAALVILTLTTAPSPGYRGEQPPSAGAGDTAPLDANELHALTAPIALYPDPLVAQVLSASTFPDQVAVANYWLEQNRALTGGTLTQAVDKQPWNASVKALTQFPSVLDSMAKNLNWTSSLGEAWHNQPSDVMAAIQALRAEAKAAGNLKSGPQIAVTQPSPQTIAIEPANPQVVYVPQYDPAYIYGIPYVTPGYTPAAVAAGTMLGFGAGVAVGAGWNSWNTDWAGGSVVYNHNYFYGNSAWHAGYDDVADRYANTASRGFASRAADESHDWDRSRLDSAHGGDDASWTRADDAFRSSNAFSDFDRRLSGGGWLSRANSFRGWSSMRSSGFFGGRFGGGGFGGGRFRGGFRR
jgi:hypothetical protein